MENLELVNPGITEAVELKTLLGSKYDSIIEKTYRIDDMYWDIEKEGMNCYLIKNIGELVTGLNNELTELFAAEEEIIFSEIDHAANGQSIVESIRNDNGNILTMFKALESTLGCKDDIRKDKELLQAEMISAADLIQKNIYKKENIFLNELRGILPEEKLNAMVQKIKSTI